LDGQQWRAGPKEACELGQYNEYQIRAPETKGISFNIRTRKCILDAPFERLASADGVGVWARRGICQAHLVEEMR
jgi:hypothetical protein